MEPMTTPLGADDKPKYDPANYHNWRRIDLEYAIIWNRLKGKDIPDDAKISNVNKKKIVNFCEYHEVDMNLCETYIDRHNTLRIKRPPKEHPRFDIERIKEFEAREAVTDKEDKEEKPTADLQKAETEQPRPEMEVLREKAKKAGINSFGKSKAELKKLLRIE